MSIKHIDTLRSIIKERGVDGFAEFIDETLTTEDTQLKMRPEDYSIKSIHDALVAEGKCYPINESRQSGLQWMQEAGDGVDSTAFPKATGALINAKIIESYDLPELIGDKLVDTIPSNVRKETIVGFDDVIRPDTVQEGTPYPHTGFGEKYVTGTNLKYGEILAITDEAIRFDQTGQILRNASKLGEKAVLQRERLIVRGVTELVTGAYNPQGTSTTLYSTANSNLSASSPFGRAGLKAVLNVFNDMTDSEDDPILATPTTLLVPGELVVDAWEFLNSPGRPRSSERGDNFFQGRYDILTSPYLTSATDWWLGNFPKEFLWTEVYPLQTLMARPGNEDEFNSDIRAKFKVRFFGDLIAVDTKYVVEANA